MNKLTLVAIALGAAALAGCQQSPQEERAENIQANADNAADAFEAAAENTNNEAAEQTLENQAEGIRDAGENLAENVAENGG